MTKVTLDAAPQERLEHSTSAKGDGKKPRIFQKRSGLFGVNKGADPYEVARLLIAKKREAAREKRMQRLDRAEAALARGRG